MSKSRRRTATPATTHALRLDPPAIVQAGISATLAFFIAWLIEQA
jgi:hypothetical protein